MKAVEETFETQYSWLLIFFLLAQTAPLFIQECLERNIFSAMGRILKQTVTLAPLHFIFQAKIIGEYLSTEIVYGGAKYLPTGRGLPTERRAFVSNEGGLYQDYAALAFYDGARLLGTLALMLIHGKLPEAVAAAGWIHGDGHLEREGERHFPVVFCVVVAATAVSWLFAPFLFNPYQFASKYFGDDLRKWCGFFFLNGGTAWEEWYTKAQLHPGSGVRASIVDVISWGVLLHLVLNW